MTPSGGLGHVLQKEKNGLQTRHKFKKLVSFIEHDHFIENFVKNNALTKITFIEMITFFQGFSFIVAYWYYITIQQLKFNDFWKFHKKNLEKCFPCLQSDLSEVLFFVTHCSKAAIAFFRNKNMIRWGKVYPFNSQRQILNILLFFHRTAFSHFFQSQHFAVRSLRVYNLQLSQKFRSRYSQSRKGEKHYAKYNKNNEVHCLIKVFIHPQKTYALSSIS